MGPNSFGDELQVLNILPIASITEDIEGSAIDLKGYDGDVAIVLDADNVAGTEPTLALKMQESSTQNAEDFTDVVGGGFTGLTTLAAVQKIVINRDELKRYIRIVGDIDYAAGEGA